MALPKPVRPEYNFTIPSSGKRIKFQPFSVREEKVLILAAESEETDEISNAIRNTLERCVTTPGFTVDGLALFDIEYLFLKCRAKSAGETIKVTVTDPEDATFSKEIDIDIDAIKVQKSKDHTDLIMLDDETSVKMTYPDISFFEEGIDYNSVEAMTTTISKCVSQIVIGEEVYSRSDLSADDIGEWVDGLTQSQYQKILKFFETMPRLEHSITETNPKTQKKFKIKLEGLSAFF